MILRYFLLLSCAFDCSLQSRQSCRWFFLLYCKVMQRVTSCRRSIVQCENSSDRMLPQIVVQCENSSDPMTLKIVQCELGIWLNSLWQNILVTSNVYALLYNLKVYTVCWFKKFYTRNKLGGIDLWKYLFHWILLQFKHISWLCIFFLWNSKHKNVTTNSIPQTS